MRRWIEIADALLDRILLLFFLFLFLIGGYTMYDTAMVYYHAQDTSVLKYKPTADGSGENTPVSEEAAAWLTIDDTGIDYPVMQGKDNNEYLNKDPYGNYSLAGSIFLDARNAADFSDLYSLIYGHHMEYGAMFGALDEFLDSEYFSSHRNGTLILTDGTVYGIRLFACVEADASVNEIFAPTETDGTLDYVQEHAVVCFEPEGEKLLGLSTCKYPETSERIIVFGVLYDENEQTTDK